MKDTTKQLSKKCPVCGKQYPEEDNYCGSDGSLLEATRPPMEKQNSAPGTIDSRSL